MDTLNPDNPEHAAAWLTSALTEYAVSLRVIGGCGRRGCIVLMVGRDAHPQCKCHENPHMMLEYAKATHRFAHRIFEEVENINKVIDTSNQKLTK